MKLKIEEVQSGSIVWRADLLQSGPKRKDLRKYHGAIEADTVIVKEFVESIGKQLKCVGDLNITMTRSLDETVHIAASYDEAGVTGYNVTSNGNKYPGFVKGPLAE